MVGSDAIEWDINLHTSFTSHINFDAVNGVIGKGGIDGDENCGSPLSAACAGAHTQNV